MNKSLRIGKLEDIIEFKNGKRAPKNKGDIPVYGGNGVLGLCGSSNFRNIIIVGRVGAYCGSVHIERDSCWVSDNAIAGNPKADSYNPYNYYLLKCLGLNKKQIGSSQPLLTQEILSKISLPIEFDTYKQRYAVSILENIDKKIELNKEINKELEAMAKLIYDYWFVQFDFPDADGKPYKSSGGKMVYNEILKREVPAGWTAMSVSNLLDVVTGKEDANYATEDGSYHFFTCGDSILRCSDYAFEGKSILLAGNGNFNVKKYNGQFNAYQRTYVLIPSDPNHYSLVYFAIKNKVEQLTNSSRGSIVQFITKGDIEEIMICLPDNDSYFYKIINDMFDKVDVMEKEIVELESLRNWLLPMLMNGQVTVQDSH